MTKRPKVLIVDDEETIVLGLVRILYQDNAIYDVLMASTAETAEQILTENKIDVMVTDIRMPGRSGVDLLCWAATASPETRVIIVTAYDISQFRDKAYRFGCLEIVQKPFDLHEMRRLITQVLENKDDLHGKLDSLTPADIVQMLCLNTRSVSLRLVEGDSSGVLHIEKGEIIHGIIDDEVGEEAVYRILRAKRGLFNTLPLPRQPPRSVHSPWQHLMMEAMRRDDEQRAGKSGDLGGSGKVTESRETKGADKGGFRDGNESKRALEPRPVPSKTDDLETSTGTPKKPAEAWDSAVKHSRTAESRETEAAALIDRGLEAVRARDFGRAREIWEEALRLDPNNRMVELNLRRLSRMRSD